jgi:hypothetical protein
VHGSWPSAIRSIRYSSGSYSGQGALTDSCVVPWCAIGVVGEGDVVCGKLDDALEYCEEVLLRNGKKNSRGLSLGAADR